jgi:tetratricopeptide (TPR) repeat protein
MREADAHFRRGVELYDDGDMSGALAELSRAYALVPSYRILYNLGQVSYQQRDYARALEHFRRYLREGGAALPRPRRDQVEDDIQRLERRVGHIEILTEGIDDGSDVLLDDVKVATAPVADPLLANVGQRKLELVRPTGARSVRLVEVTGGEMAHVLFARPVPGLPASTRAGVDGGPTTASRASELLSGSAGASGRAGDGFHALSTPAWVTWAATAALAAGAATTGVLALSASRDLQQRRDTFPLAPGELDGPAGRARGLALTTDGLLAGTLVMAAVSLYLTFERPAGSGAAEAAEAGAGAPTGTGSRGGASGHARSAPTELGHWVSQYP